MSKTFSINVLELSNVNTEGICLAGSICTSAEHSLDIYFVLEDGAVKTMTGKTRLSKKSSE